ncbi:MAG: beta-galactosidase, partial [Roseiflexaceae bacterium]
MSLRMRQIHMDFHTSELINGVGAQFDEEVFADVLKQAEVNSVTIFARCHHGMLYYPSKRFPERVHPHMQGDLLGAQLRACRAANINAPIYITVQWDYHTVLHHPEWLAMDAQGNPFSVSRHGQPLFEAGFYRFLCVGSPYRDFLMESVRDLV